MTDEERNARYDALTDAEREAFHVKLNEYADTLLNPNQGPYDNAHWHKQPPSPIIVTTADPKPGETVTATAAPAPVASAPTVPAANRSFWGGWGKR